MEPTYFEVAKYAFTNATFSGGYVADEPPEDVWVLIEKEGQEPIALVMTATEAMVLTDILISALIQKRIQENAARTVEVNEEANLKLRLGKALKGLVKGVGKVVKGFAKNPLKAIVRSPLKVGLPVLGASLLLSQLGKRKKVTPEVPAHLQPLQAEGSQLGQALLGYGQQALQQGISPTELQLAGQEAQLGGIGGQMLPYLGTLLGGLTMGAGLTGLQGLGRFTRTESIFERPEYQELFGGLRQQARRAMQETVSPILSQMQAMGLGTSSAAISELGRAQERIMEDLQRQIAQIAAGGLEAEQQRALAAASQLAGMLPQAFALPEAGVMGGLQALGAGITAAGLPRAIAQSILGMSPLAGALLAQGQFPMYRPSTLEQLLSAGGQAAAIYDIMRG
jgi:hypothetical protein